MKANLLAHSGLFVEDELLDHWCGGSALNVGYSATDKVSVSAYAPL